MQIRVGFEMAYRCPQPTPMLLVLNVHYTRVSDLVTPDLIVTSPSVPIRAYRDRFQPRGVDHALRSPGPGNRIRHQYRALVEEPSRTRPGRRHPNPARHRTRRVPQEGQKRDRPMMSPCGADIPVRERPRSSHTIGRKESNQ